MKLSDFDFALPKERIALRPARPRDAARLLEVRTEGLADKAVRDLPVLLAPGDVMVFNDTRVIPARLSGTRGAAKVEATLHMRLDPVTWAAFVRPAKKFRLNDLIDFSGLLATVIERREGGEVVLRFDAPDLDAALSEHGVMPLPPYIAGQRAPDAADLEDYQTIYGRRAGAVAAPTAGLHFTERLLAELKDAGIGFAHVTLHVGAGTFLPVKTETVAEHKMHAEWGEITAETAEALNAVRKSGRRIVSVGTTSLRLLESAAEAGGRIRPFSGGTDIFITPGYRFKGADLLMTNFHLPKSTLFMLVSAFTGLERMRLAYAHAVEAGYRFYSYGDACLLHPGSDVS